MAFHDCKDQTTAICPITILWKPPVSPSYSHSDTEHTVLWIWVHPCAYEEFQQAISRFVHSENNDGKQCVMQSVLCLDDVISFNDISDQMARFDFVGPRQQAYLGLVLNDDRPV